MNYLFHLPWTQKQWNRLLLYTKELQSIVCVCVCKNHHYRKVCFQNSIDSRGNIMQKLCLKFIFGSWRDGSEVKSTYCSLRGPKFGSQHHPRWLTATGSSSSKGTGWLWLPQAPGLNHTQTHMWLKIMTIILIRSSLGLLAEGRGMKEYILTLALPGSVFNEHCLHRYTKPYKTGISWLS